MVRFLLVPAALLLLAIALTAMMLLLAARRPRPGVLACPGCGYDLSHLGERRQCPECGRPFRLDERGRVIE